VRLSPSAKLIKRTIDVVTASVLLVVLSPLLAYIAARIKLDYMYVSTWSPRGDLKLLLRTVGVVFQARAAY